VFKLSFRLLDESIRWLGMKGKIDQAVGIITEIAKTIQRTK
jgi:hypothetical protein